MLIKVIYASSTTERSLELQRVCMANVLLPHAALHIFRRLEICTSDNGYAKVRTPLILHLERTHLPKLSIISTTQSVSQRQETV